MGLKGSAFLAIWHDIAAGAHDEYIEWHTREHMPERLSIPGFRTGKRLHAPNASRHVSGTIYSGDDIEVFRSTAYLHRLNNPTPWTAAVAPSFRNFLRVACDLVGSAGLGDGGAMATLRFDFAGPDSNGTLRACAGRLLDEVLALQRLRRTSWRRADRSRVLSNERNRIAWPDDGARIRRGAARRRRLSKKGNPRPSSSRPGTKGHAHFSARYSRITECGDTRAGGTAATPPKIWRIAWN